MKKLISIHFTALITAIVLIFSACTKDNAGEFDYDRVVLLYLAANNNLASYASGNMDAIKTGYLPYEDDRNILLVYSHISGSLPVLLRLYKDREGVVHEDVVNNYDQQNSSSSEVLEEVLERIKVIFPAAEYGLILWSHGTGWLPEGYYDTKSGLGVFYPDPYADIVKSFGEDSGVEMEIPELAEAIPYHLSFIIFDCCFMGGIETVYELKDKCDYVVASPTEILATGFPYDRIMAPLFEKEADLEEAGDLFYDFYNRQSGVYCSATLAIYRTDKLDNLAQACRTVFNNHRTSIAQVNLSAIQEYYRMNKHWFYDLSDFVKQISSSSEYAKFTAAVDEVVVKKWSTEFFIDIKIDSFSGISTYIPVPLDTYLDNFYMRYKWNEASEMIRYNLLLSNNFLYICPL
jgi:hypothetical protein